MNKKGAKANMDLVRETGAGGYMNDYFAGASKLKGGEAMSNKMAQLMNGGGFT